MADLSDEILQPFKISHLPRTDFELCMLDLFNILSVGPTIDVCNLRCIDLHELEMLLMCPSTRHREKLEIEIICLNLKHL